MSNIHYTPTVTHVMYTIQQQYRLIEFDFYCLYLASSYSRLDVAEWVRSARACSFHEFTAVHLHHVHSLFNQLTGFWLRLIHNLSNQFTGIQLHQIRSCFSRFTAVCPHKIRSCCCLALSCSSNSKRLLQALLCPSRHCRVQLSKLGQRQCNAVLEPRCKYGRDSGGFFFL